MKLILRIAFRNLFRQKSRSILIGLGIVMSVIFMSMFSSLIKGVSSNIMNIIVDANIVSHLGVYSTEKEDKKSRPIIRDRDGMVALIKKHIKNVKDVKDVLICSSFAIGNRRSRNLYIMGITNSSTSLEKEYKLLSGDFTEFYNESIENPLILEYRIAEALNVEVGEVVKVRLNNIYGQIQTARLNVVAIVDINNPLLVTYGFSMLPLKALKDIMGYGQNEIQYLNVTLKNIDNLDEVVPYADELHKKLTPKPVFVKGVFIVGGKNANGVIAGLKSDEESVALYEKHINVTSGDIKSFSGAGNKVMISKSLARILCVVPGEMITFSYYSRSREEDVKMSFEVATVFDDQTDDQKPLAFINEMEFFKSYFDSPLEKYDSDLGNSFLSGINTLIPALAHSFRLLERTYTSLDYQIKTYFNRRASVNGTLIDIVSLKEINDRVQNYEKTLNMIGFASVIVILSIILAGVLNTVRMNIRERIREIGTVRAVGMQKKLVIRTLVVEVGLLAVLSSLLGILASSGLMDLASLITFPTNDINFALMLDDGHILFKPAIKVIIINTLVIISLIMLAAWFPARKAAKMPIGEALGHYE